VPGRAQCRENGTSLSPRPVSLAPQHQPLFDRTMIRQAPRDSTPLESTNGETRSSPRGAPWATPKPQALNPTVYSVLSVQGLCLRGRPRG
jgi:hypothetical protein